MHRVEELSIREIASRTGLHRKMIRRALRAHEPPRYRRPPKGLKLDHHREEIARLLQTTRGSQNTRIRCRGPCELAGGGFALARSRVPDHDHRPAIDLEAVDRDRCAGCAAIAQAGARVTSSRA